MATESLTIHVPLDMADTLRNQAKKANVSLSRYCIMLMESEKATLLLERQELMKTIYELRIKILCLEGEKRNVCYDGR